MIPEWLQLASVIASPLFAAGAAWAAVRTELKWLRRDVDDAHARIDALDREGTLSTGKLKALLGVDREREAPRAARWR